MNCKYILLGIEVRIESMLCRKSFPVQYFCSFRKIAPIILFYHWKVDIIHAVVYAFRRKERNTRAHKAKCTEKRLIMLLIQL